MNGGVNRVGVRRQRTLLGGHEPRLSKRSSCPLLCTGATDVFQLGVWGALCTLAYIAQVSARALTTRLLRGSAALPKTDGRLI